MKPLRYYKQLFLAMGLLGTLPTYALAQDTWFPGELNWDYSGSRVERSLNGDSLVIELTVSPSVKLRGQEMVYIFPRYVSADGKESVELEPVCISGKKRYKVIKRRKALHNQKAGQPGSGDVYSIDGLKEAPLTFKSSFPFERWMADGHVAVKERIYGCAECGTDVHGGTAIVGNIPLFGERNYTYDFIKPEKVEIKCYRDSLDCRVSFPVAHHELQKGFGDNRQELVKLAKFISENLTIKGAELREVNIRGYASPEGKFDYNKVLAERRTRSLSDYVTKEYPQLQKAAVYQVTGMGEDWEGLRTGIKGSSLSNKEEILSIIDRYEIDTERETAIRKLDNGSTYDILLKEFYPALRRTIFSMSLDIRPYTLEELPEVFMSKPECLSLYEMYQLAGLFVSRGEDPVHVYKKAYEQFPGDVVAILNYAHALLKYKEDADAALIILESVKDDSRALFPMAIAYNMKGDWRKAEELLKEAAVRGDIRAKKVGIAQNR